MAGFLARPLFNINRKIPFRQHKAQNQKLINI